MSRKRRRVIREQNVESAFQLAALIDSGSPRGNAVQEEAYLATLETSIAWINDQAAVCAVRGDCGGGFGLIDVANAGDQYRVGRRLRSSAYEHQPRYEHHRLSDFWSRGWRWCRRSNRRICRNGCRSRRRLWQRRESQVEVGLNDRNSMGLICVCLIGLYIAEKEGNRLSCERCLCRHGDGCILSLRHNNGALIRNRRPCRR